MPSENYIARGRSAGLLFAAGLRGSRHPHGHHVASLPIRFRQRLRERGVAGRAAGRAKQSAAAAVRPLHRRDQRHAVHGAARREPALLDVSHPSVGRARAVSGDPAGLIRSAPFDEAPASPNQLRWRPLPIPKEPTDFVAGLVTMGGNGDPAQQTGAAVHLYAANASMVDRFFYDADGELLIVPQQGALTVRTELGVLHVAPSEFCVVPRGVKFRVEVDGTVARLRLRKLRRALPLARARADRHERPRELARLPVARRGVRGARRRLPRRRQILGQALGSEDRPLPARHRRVARHLRAVQVRPEALQHDQHGHLRPPGSVDLLGAHGADGDSRAPRTSTSA